MWGGKTVIHESARKHFILDSEIRGAVFYPIVRYQSCSRVFPDTVVEIFIGGRRGGPWIEVVCEDKDGVFHVFHAMMLTRRTALEIEAATGRSVSLTGDIVAQRSRFPRQER
jgi:hypothetical protein